MSVDTAKRRLASQQVAKLPDDGPRVKRPPRNQLSGEEHLREIYDAHRRPASSKPHHISRYVKRYARAHVRTEDAPRKPDRDYSVLYAHRLGLCLGDLNAMLEAFRGVRGR